MYENNFNKSFLGKLTERLSNYSTLRVIVIGTLFVLGGSIPLVYFFALAFNVEYTMFFFLLSIFLPLLLSPTTLFLFIKMTRYLSYFKKHLDQEIENNKKKDILIHEQARFALMGEMIANISHQWKQPLNTMGLSIVKARTSKEKDLDQCFDIVEDNIRYLASTIDDFISFFDKRTDTEVRDINEVLKEINSITSSYIQDKEIKIIIDMDYVCNKIVISSSISQVLLNLVNNSVDAFEKMKKSKKIALKFICNENSFTILCFDNGTGIKDDIVEKIYAPYFTTKDKKQGTGIGLYMSKQIVNKFFDGSIKVLPKHEFLKGFEDMNTCFKISIPYSQNCMMKETI